MAIRGRQVVGLVIAGAAVWLARTADARSVAAFPLGQSSGIEVSNSIFNEEVVPGGTYVHTMVLSVPSDSPPLKVTVRAMGMGQSTEGAVVPIEPEADKSPYSGLASIVGLDRTELLLAAGETAEVNATIAVPPDLRNEGRYAVIHIGTEPTAGRAVAFQLAVDVPVILNPVGATYRETGAITEHVVQPVVPGSPIVVETVFTNTGNHHYKALAQVRLLNESGRVLAERSTALTEMSIVPTFARRFRVTFGFLEQLRGLPPGRYIAESRVVHADGTVLASRSAEFVIAEPLVPFPGLSEQDVFLAEFESEEPGCVDARPVAPLEVCFADTGTVTGMFAVGRHREPPAVPIRLEEPPAQGGLGKAALGYASVRVDGFERGSAEIKWHYDEDQLGAVEPNSLFLAHLTPDAWLKLDDLAVFTGAGVVQGRIRVATLAGAPVVAMAGEGPMAVPSAGPALDKVLAGAGLLGVLWVVGTVFFRRRRA